MRALRLTRPNMRGRDVVQLRTQLTKMGFNAGDVKNEVYDASLAMVVGLLQESHNYPATFMVDEQTWFLVNETQGRFQPAQSNWEKEIIRQSVLLQHVPYINGSSDPSLGLDSFGFMMCVCMRATPIALVDMSVNDVYQRTKAPLRKEPLPSDWQFYGDDGKAYHTMLVLSDILGIGAVGGNSATRDRLMALRRDARVKIRPLNYRSGKMEFRTSADVVRVLSSG